MYQRSDDLIACNTFSVELVRFHLKNRNHCVVYYFQKSSLTCEMIDIRSLLKIVISAHYASSAESRLLKVILQKSRDVRK